MTPVNHQPCVPREFEMQIRVRYQETDAQGRVHHSNFTNYFEVARVEMLRASGKTYRDLEAEGLLLVVVKLTCQYHRPANYDDLLTLKTRVTKARGVRITHQYEIFRDQELLVEGETVVAAVDRSGEVVRLPNWLRFDKGERV